MAWPFRNKSPQRLSPEVEKVFDKLWNILQDEPAQVAQYPEPLRSQMTQGADVDQNATGHGPFGTNLTNPIPANGPIGEILYLSALRIGDKRLLFHRIASVQAIDVFECCSIDGGHWDLLFLDMYHPRKSRKAADGYQLAQNNVLIGGISQEVADFPRTLYPTIVEYSKKRFGMSIADPEVRLATEKVEFERPDSHVARLRKISAGAVASGISATSKNEDSDDVELGIHIAYMILPQLCLFDESWSSVEVARENLRRRRLPRAHDAYSIGYLAGFIYTATKPLEVALGEIGAAKVTTVMSVVFLELFGALNGPLLHSKIPKLEADILFQRGMNAGATDADGTRSGGAPLQWARYLFSS